MLKNFSEAENYLNSHVRSGNKQIFQGKKGIEKMKFFLSLLNSPQDKLKIIHVAGTAGKGSTCYLISRLLVSHGFKVGLHLSPHLIDVLERFQIDNLNINKNEFVKYLNEIIPAVKEVEKSDYKNLSYFEVLVGLAFYIFNKKKVDYLVLETGLGGLYDATNVIDREDKISVITRIGYDHMQILGNTLKEIAFQKAMIINHNSQAITFIQEKEIIDVIRKVAKKKNAELFFTSNFNINLSLIGDHQKENAALALKTLELISKRDKFKIDKAKVNKVFKTTNFLGRFDIKRINNKTVILDGAHNQPKMDAFISSLKTKYPNKKFHFLIAFKKGKDYKTMLKYIVPISSKITITSFFVDNQDLIHLSEDPEIIKKDLEKLNFNNIEIVKLPKLAIKETLETNDKLIVITGSLYLLGEIFKIL